MSKKILFDIFYPGFPFFELLRSRKGQFSLWGRGWGKEREEKKLEFNGPPNIVNSLTLGTYDFYKRSPKGLWLRNGFFIKKKFLLRMLVKY